MTVKLAAAEDAAIIHSLMIRAFSIYRNTVPPSTALDETVQSIESALAGDEKAFICYCGGEPAGMVRLTLHEDTVYFFRLSVVPEMQGKGIAKQLLRKIEEYAREQGKSAAACKVRGDLPGNIRLYESAGYRIYDEETMIRENEIKLRVVSMKKQLI